MSLDSQNRRRVMRTRVLKYVGSIPEHWGDAIIGDIFYVQLGKMLSEASKTGTRYRPYLGNWNVKWGAFDLERVEQMDFDDDEFEKFKLADGDILVCEGGEVGRTAIWRSEIQDCCYQKALHRLRPKSGVIVTGFFRYYMQEASRQNLFARYTTESSIAHLTRETLVKLHIPLPPIEEQESIVAILDSVDEAIGATQVMIGQTRRLKSALLDQFILRGLPGHKTKFTRQRLGELFEERNERGVLGLPTMSVTMGEGLVDRESLDRRILSDLTPQEHLLVRKKDIAYNMMRMWQGVFGLALQDGIVSPAYVILKPKPGIDSLFASYLFRHPTTIRKFERFSQGLTGDRLRLYFDQFATIPVEIPNLETQQQTAAVLQAVDNHIEAEESKLLTLQSLKTALSQGLLTGRISVSVSAAKSAANVGKDARKRRKD